MIKLHYKQDYLSIRQFNDVELPPLAVLTGVNGSGKSHLLRAIAEGKVDIQGIENPSIVFFNYETFKLENEGTFSAQQISQERESGWNLFNEQSGANIKTHMESLKNSFSNYRKVCDIAQKKGVSLWGLTSAEIGDDAAASELATYRKKTEAFFRRNSHLKGNVQANSILALIKKLPVCADELERDEFLNTYKPFNFKNDFLPQELGKIMWDYYVKQRENEVNEYQNEKHGKQYPFIPEKDFVKKHGEKPWEVINKILEKFSSLDYRINTPEGQNHFGNYKVQLSSLSDPKVHPEFTDLSSGERILMALVASIYKASFDDHFPDVLLLDEIDASLHPSMIQNLLEVVEDIFIKKGVNVFLVTHSPTTIAIAPDESIYVVNKKGQNKIEKKPKQDALSILTEGFATLEKGLKLFDEISKAKISVLTEGKNTDLIKRALDLEGIKDVEVITGAETSSGKDQLKTLFQFFCKVPHT
jgi:ABC-type branched-subunit amino acid transport system ATPase component